MILCNGLPKSGTNLLLKLYGLIGLENNGVIIRKYSPEDNFSCSKFENEKIRISINLSEAVDFNETYFCHGHLVFDNYSFLETHKVVTIFRDPRDVIISTIRDPKQRLPKNQTMDQLIEHLLINGPTPYVKNSKRNWVEYYRLYLPWINKGNFIFFDDLKNISQIKNLLPSYNINEEIVQHLFSSGKMLPNGKEAYIERSTWSGEHSKWKDYWSKEIDLVWNNIGGQELLDDIEKLKNEN